MATKQRDTMLYFPLYSLRYSTDHTKTLDYILCYCIVEYGYRLYSNFILKNGDTAWIDRAVTKNPIANFNYEDEEHYYVVFASLKYNIKIYDIHSILDKHKAIVNFISYYEYKYGKDVRVKIHVDLLLDTKNNRFDYNLFRLYCAIKSVLGKKSFCRITSDRLRYRMQGYKSQKVYEIDCAQDKLLTRRQIEARIEKLIRKKFVSTITYNRRLKFFSTRYRDKQLEDLVVNSISLSKALKAERKARSERLGNRIELKVLELKTQINQGVEVSGLQNRFLSEMKLVK